MDAAITREVLGYFKIFSGYSGGTILDLGANIGAFSFECNKRYPSSLVVAVEPDPENFSLLVKNAPNAVHIQAAVSKYDGSTFLYLNEGENKGLHSIREIQGRKSKVVVATISFSSLLEKYKPEVLKIDIEDAEYYISEELSNLPDCVKAIAIELHLRPKVNRQVNAPVLLSNLIRQFPNQLRGTSIPRSTWAMTVLANRYLK